MRSYILCIFYSSEMNSLMQGKLFKNSKRTLPKESISQEKLCRFPRKVYPQDSGDGFKNLLRIRSKKTSTKSKPTYIGRQFRNGIEFEKHHV